MTGGSIAGYLEAKRELAEAFEALLVSKFVDRTVITATKRQIEAEMRKGDPLAPPQYLKVRGYGEVHARLLSYLVGMAGQAVSASELRMLTGDAVHTERRARELRDLGYHLEAKHAGGSDVYVLESLEPDLGAAAAYLVKKNITEDRGISKARAAELICNPQG